MIHVIDVGCWQAEMYGYGCWLEAIKRKTVVGDRIKFWCDLYCVSCNDYVCKMQTGKIWLGFFVASHVPTNVSLSPFCFRCHVPEPTNQATPVYLNSIQIVVWYIIDIFVRAMSYKEPGGVRSVRLEIWNRSSMSHTFFFHNKSIYLYLGKTPLHYEWIFEKFSFFNGLNSM
jgi:hypothetical protein